MKLNYGYPAFWQLGIVGPIIWITIPASQQTADSASKMQNALMSKITPLLYGSFVLSGVNVSFEVLTEHKISGKVKMSLSVN